MKYLNDAARFVEEYLDESLPDGDPVSRAARYAVGAGGKRLRPALVFAAGETFGAAREDLLPLAGAVECIHTYSLIHDDLPCMDDDELRRGRPSCHIAFGVPVAVEAGALLLAEAFLLAFSFETERYREIATVLSEGAGARGMVGGQILDISAEGRDDVTLEELREIHGRKTGALITASILLGAIGADLPESLLVPLARFGRSVGLAFQVVDDILDLESTSRDLGKPVGSDLARGKSTYPGLLGTEGARSEAERLLSEARASLDSLPASGGPLLELAEFIVRRRN